MQLKTIYILIVTLSFLLSSDINSDNNTQSKEEKKRWSLFKKKDKSNSVDELVDDENIEEEKSLEESSEEDSKLSKKEKKKAEKKKKKEEKKKKKAEKKKKKAEKKKDKKGLFNFLKKKSDDEESSEEELKEENDLSDSSTDTDSSEGNDSLDESATSSEQDVIDVDTSNNELVQAIIAQNKKIDLLIQHLDPSESIVEDSESDQDSTDMLELLQIVQNKFSEIDLAVSGSDSLFMSISKDMENLQNKIESINIRLETKIQSIEMSSDIYTDELNQRVDSLEENFSSGGSGIQELKDMNKDLILKMLKVDDKYSSEISRLEGKIEELQNGMSNLKEINKDLVVSALTQPKDDVVSKPSSNTKKSSSKISKSIYKKKYDEAYLAYLDANYDKSLSIFQELLNINDANDLTDNCQYWVGEIYYSMKDYNQAIDAFNAVFNYKENNKGAYAYYKLGLCYLNVDNTDKAVESFNKVVSDYSNQSDLVKKSEQFISKYSK